MGADPRPLRGGAVTPVLQARGLRKVHGSGAAAVIALRDVDLDLGHGEFLAVTGPSGCGKSTLLNLLGGLDRPTAGEILLHGERVERRRRGTARAPAAHRGRLRVPVLNLIANLTVADDVEFPALLAGVPSREARRRAADLLERLGLADTGARVPGALSGGQQQRVAIARALVNRPTVLLADEPTGNLDSAAAREVVGVLRERAAEGQAIVLVTHDLRVASAAQRVLRMKGRRGRRGGGPRGGARPGRRAEPRSAAGGFNRVLRAAVRLIRADLAQRPVQAAPADRAGGRDRRRCAAGDDAPACGARRAVRRPDARDQRRPCDRDGLARRRRAGGVAAGGGRGRRRATPGPRVRRPGAGAWPDRAQRGCRSGRPSTARS